MSEYATLVESMTPLRIAGYRVRVWRQEEQGYGWQVDNSDLKLVAGEITGQDGMVGIAKRLIAFDRVNAVEVLNGLGEGVVLYKDWP